MTQKTSLDKGVLLGELRACIASVPDFTTYVPTSRHHLEWLGRADSLVGRWDGFQQITFRGNVDNLARYPLHRPFYLGQLLTILHRAEADVALDVPNSAQTVFGPGAVYDFLKALRDILGLAKRSLFIVDPYLDDQIFDTYLSTVAPSVDVRLLARQYAQALKASLEKFNRQNGTRVNVRVAQALHDRVVFVDGGSCWVLGQSIKDAAKRGPTYVAPLSGDAVSLKLAAYEDLWRSALPL